MLLMLVDEQVDDQVLMIVVVGLASDPIQVLIARRCHQAGHPLIHTTLILVRLLLSAENTCRKIGSAI